MPSSRFTTASVKTFKTDKPQQDFWDGLVPRFGIRVSRTGRKVWIVFPKVLVNGKWKKKRFTLGAYTDEFGLTKARDMARNAIAVAVKGGDPTDAINLPLEKKVVRSRNSYGAVRDEYLKKYRTKKLTKPRPRTLEEMRRVMSGERFKEWENKPIADIKKQDILNLLDNLIGEGKDVTANKTLVVLRQLFNWAEKRGIIETVPTDRIDRPGAEQSRDRVLTDEELRAVWGACYGTGGRDSHIHGDIVRILILKGQRRNEVAGMSWSELDLDSMTWEIPADRAKNKKPHIVPLTLPVMEILKRQQELQEETEQSEFVFTTNGKRPFSGWSKSKERLDNRSEVTGWRLHDLRRSVITGINEMGIQPHIVEAVVNHVSGTRGGVAGTYNKALYLEERRRALGAWARHVSNLVLFRTVTK